jgi:hypothetical protein
MEVGMLKKARDLAAGDLFRLHVYGEVLAVSPVGDGKRVKIKIELENQGRRANSGASHDGSAGALEFTDAGYVLEFICRPGRTFQVYSDVGWDADGDAVEPVPPHDLIDA